MKYIIQGGFSMYHFTDLEIDAFSDDHLENYKYELHNIKILSELNDGIAGMVIRFCNPVSRLFPMFEGISKYCVKNNDYAQTLRDLIRRGLKEHFIKYDTTEAFFRYKDNSMYLGTLRSKDNNVKVTVSPNEVYDAYSKLFAVVNDMLNDTRFNKWKSNYFELLASYGIEAIRATMMYAEDVSYALDINTDAAGSFCAFGELFDRSFPKWKNYKINKISDIYNFFTLVITALNSLYHYQVMQLAEYQNFSITIDNESEYHRIIDLMEDDHDEYVDMVNNAMSISKDELEKRIADMMMGEENPSKSVVEPIDDEDEPQEQEVNPDKPKTERKNGVLYFDFSNKNKKKDDEDKKENS